MLLVGGYIPRNDSTEQALFRVRSAERAQNIAATQTPFFTSEAPVYTSQLQRYNELVVAAMQRVLPPNPNATCVTPQSQRHYRQLVAGKKHPLCSATQKATHRTPRFPVPANTEGTLPSSMP